MKRRFTIELMMNIDRLVSESGRLAGPNDSCPLVKTADDPFRKILLDFLKGAECSRLSISCRQLYDRLQYSSGKTSSVSLWMQLFQRDFPKSALEANKILIKMIYQKSLSSIEAGYIQSQFYRTRVTLPLSLCNTFNESVNGSVSLFTALTDGRVAWINRHHDTDIRLLTKDRVEAGVLCGHTKTVRCLLALPEGGLASGSGDNTICLWNKDGHIVRTLLGHEGGVNCLTLLPCGRMASGSADTTIRLWNRDGSKVGVLCGHGSSVTCLSVRLDGGLVSGSLGSYMESYDCSISLWNKNGEQTDIFPTSKLRRLIALSDGRIASSSGKRMNLWAKGKEPVQFGHYGAYNNALILLSDGTLLSGSTYKMVCFWDVNKTSVMEWSKGPRRFGVSGSVQSLTELPDRRLAVGLDNGIISLRDKDGEQSAVLRGHTQSVSHLVVLSDGQLASAGDDGIRFWDVLPQDLVNGALERSKGMAKRLRGYRSTCSIL